MFTINRRVTLGLLGLMVASFTGCSISINIPLTESAGEVPVGESCSLASSTLTVAELYPTFTRWNDYVRRADPTTVCGAGDAGAGGYRNCIHAGERRKVELPVSVTSCTGVTAQDALGAFSWRCDDSTSPVFVYSYRLKEGKGLADLIEPTTGTSFLSNSVSVYVNNCEKYKTTSSTTWWTNTISVAPGLSTAGTQSLSTSYQIYTIPDGTNGTTDGFSATADGVALVVLGDDVLQKYGTVTGPPGSFFSATNRKFFWVEGKFNGDPAVGAFRPDYGIYMGGTTMFSRVHKVFLKGSDDVGVILNTGVQNVLVSESVFESNAYDSGGDNPSNAGVGMWSGANYNTIHNVKVTNQHMGGALLEFAQYNVWNRIHASNSKANEGVMLNGCCGGTDSTWTEVVVIGSTKSGLGLDITKSTIGFFTVLHAGTFWNSVSFGAANITAFNGLTILPPTGQWSYSFADLAGNKLFRSASYTTNSKEIEMAGAVVANDDNRVDRGFWVSSTGCQEGGTGPLGNWLGNGTCEYGSATPSTPPDTTTLSLESVLLGRVTTDSLSPQDTGTAYTSVTDFSTLSSFYRGWSRYNSSQATELHTDHSGPCSSGNDCGIYDVRFSSNTSAISNVNGTFSASACPSSVDASVAANVMTDSATAARTFLINAVEILLDDIGNDNGLCESGESCIFAPHIGAYLGEGDYENNGVCSYAGGNGVVNYKIYGYPTVEVAE